MPKSNAYSEAKHQLKSYKNEIYKSDYNEEGVESLLPAHVLQGARTGRL